ncbi:MAG: nucleotidyltransferase domain-containing protein [Deltaproteobacteria bacterium]|nr:nucleotidyltransferase domain-containing protein [Deltaproteobacteria bacterium]
MRAKELTAEQRRIAIDAAQLYQHFLDVRQESADYRGGLHWKTVNSKEYLIRTLDRRGRQQSLGPRSSLTEARLRDFNEKKADLKRQLASLQSEIARRAKFCVAAAVNRIPRIAADIVRLLDSNRLLGTHLIILGSHAIYAYEMAAGVQLKSGLLQTEDLDTLLSSREDLEIAGEVRSTGLLGLIQKVDKSFRLVRQRSFRAINSKGFMVDLIRAPFHEQGHRTSVGHRGDLVAEPLEGLEWLADAPRTTQIVIAENGFPVRFIVPDPRVFALHKIWLSLQPTRDPMKRKRDFRQGEAVAALAMEYLNLSFDDAALDELPAALTSQRPGLLERLRSRQPSVEGDEESALPPGFDDT